MKKKWTLLLLILCLLLPSVLAGCNKQEQIQEEALTLEYFSTPGRKIGVITGSTNAQLTMERFPEAEVIYFKLMSDMILALEQGKIDAYIEDEQYTIAAQWEGANVRNLDIFLREINISFPFARTERAAEIRRELNTFLTKIEEDGTLDTLKERWLGDAEPEGAPDYFDLTGENGSIHLAVVLDNKPMLYKREDQCTGMEMEILTMFAREYGYALNIEEVAFDSILVGMAVGKYDMGAAGMNATDERKESVDFSNPYMMIDSKIAVVADPEGKNQNVRWIDGVFESFEKTFIRENRWKLILEGIGVTLLISISAALGGTLLGFGLYMLTRTDSKFLRKLALGVGKVYGRIVAGTPAVVILMILFYVIFGKLRDISGILVATIGFSLTFGAFVYGHMDVSVGSVDRGQTEAAFALGYPKNRAFYRIVFPQAMTVFLPGYCGEIVSLVKATAVVGYIAVNDLTKVGDIIRSNTYEAFFPLIATAVIYFLLTWMISASLNLVKRHFEPKRRSNAVVLKGIEAK